METMPVAKFECNSCKYSDYRMSKREVGELARNECPRCGNDLEVVAKGPPGWLTEPLGLVAEHFEISDFIASKDRIELEVTARDSKQSFRSLLSATKRKDYLPVMRRSEGELKLMVVKRPRIGKGRAIINLLLFGATCLTTFGVSYYFFFDQRLLYAGLFSGAIMFMLGIHELGHKIAMWRNDVESTLPYFIPAPPPFPGTLGAVIRVKSPIPTKEALVEMGASGPLFGFFVALPLVSLGLMLSKPDPRGVSLLFTPAIFAVMQLLIFGCVPAAMSINPLALAGWLMLFVTMINLLPAGQLDGGHVARGVMTPEQHYALTRALSFGLILLGFFFLPFLIVGFFIFLMSKSYHAGALDDVSRLSPRHKILAIAAFSVFLLCMPIPIPLG